jgi:hypothetical protein
MTVNNELEKTRLAVVVAHFKVLPQHLPGETKENHENISLRQDIDYREAFHDFPQSVQHMQGWYLKLEQYHFVPHPFHFIMRCHPVT